MNTEIKQALSDLSRLILEQDSYELFNRLLIQQEKFVPAYAPQRSSQSSSNLHHFTNHYST